MFIFFYSQDDFGKISSENRKISKNCVVISAFCTKNIHIIRIDIKFRVVYASLYWKFVLSLWGKKDIIRKICGFSSN